MVRKAATLTAALLGFAFLATPAEAASFDCARARAPDEVIVCRTPALSALDSEMGGLWYAYSRVPMYMGGRGARADEAQAFLARRRACGRNVGCLTIAYRARIADLRRGIDGAMAEYFRLQNGN
jgi:uncharacterized protein